MPKILKYPLIFLYILFRLVLRGKPSNKITLNLARVMPAPGQIVHGGKVKLIALRERFGDTWKHFNIAYFVSSGLPPQPLTWIMVYKKFGVKVVWNQNGFAYPALYPPEVVSRIHHLFKPMRKCDYVIYQSEFTKRCANKFLGAYIGNSCVLINPVDTEKFIPAPTAQPVEPFTIIMAGNHFESEERMRVSLEAVHLVRKKGINAKLIVTGRTEREFTEPWIEKVGAFTQEEAPALYRKAHILLHLKYLDPCPTNVLEALATGLPVVGQENGGMPELVGDAGILLSSSEDFERLHYPSTEAVAEAILKVRENLTEFSTKARSQALRFDKKIWLEKHEEIFNSLLK